MSKKPIKTKTRAWRSTEEDEKLISELARVLQPRLGPVNDTDLVRMGLRALAAQEGVAA